MNSVFVCNFLFLLHFVSFFFRRDETIHKHTLKERERGVNGKEPLRNSREKKKKKKKQTERCKKQRNA